VNDGEIEKNLSFFADDVNVVGFARGKDELRWFFQRDAAWNTVLTVIDARTDGNTVTATIIERSDYAKARGQGGVQLTVEYDFRDGLITEMRVKLPPDQILDQREDRGRRVAQSLDGWLRETGRKQSVEAIKAAWDARRWTEVVKIKAPLLQEWREQAIPYYEKAVSRARKALDEHPESHEHRSELARAYRSLGMARLAMEKPGNGAESFERELALWMAVPDSKRTADQWSYLGQACYLVGKHEEARRALTKSIELRGETSPSIEGPRWWYLVMTLARLGETEKANEYFDELVRMSRASADGRSKHRWLRLEAYQLLARAERKDDKASTPASRE
jgi:tetratricopeptide (TPR) repeat protein